MPPFNKENFSTLFDDVNALPGKSTKFVQGPAGYWYGGGEHKDIAAEAEYNNPTFGGTLVARVSASGQRKTFDVIPVAGSLGLGAWSSGRERAEKDLQEFAEGTDINLLWLG